MYFLTISINIYISTATNAFLNGMELTDVNRWLRHSSVAVTEKFYIEHNIMHTHNEHKKYVH